MESSMKQAARLLKEKKTYRRWLAVFLCLALIVTGGTVGALKMQGQALSHKEKVLVCQAEAHQHTDECRNAEGELICGQADYLVHAHNDDCYDSNGQLVCALPEVKRHEHTDECFEEQEILICMQKENPGHQHDESCYTKVRGEQICESTEEGHEHTDECYTWTEELTCGIAGGEGAHIHTDECYKTEKVLTCGQLELHTHDDDCYDEDGQLICGQVELKEHVHQGDCFEEMEVPAEGNSDEGIVPTDKPGEAVPTDKPETGTELTEAPDREADNQKEEPLSKECQVGSMLVKAEYGMDAEIPAGAELIVTPITDTTDIEKHEKEMREKTGNEEDSFDMLMTIGFYLDGEEIEPKGTVTITVQMPEETGAEAGDSVTVVHFGTEKTEIFQGTNVDEEGKTVFQTNSFSVYGITLRKSTASAPDFAQGFVEITSIEEASDIAVDSVGIWKISVNTKEELGKLTSEEAAIKWATIDGQKRLALDVDEFSNIYGYNAEAVTVSSKWIIAKKENGDACSNYSIGISGDGKKFWIFDNINYYNSGEGIRIYYFPENNDEISIPFWQWSDAKFFYTPILYELSDEENIWKKLEGFQEIKMISPNNSTTLVSADVFDYVFTGYTSADIGEESRCIGYHKNNWEEKIYTASLTKENGRWYWEFDVSPDSLAKIYYCPDNKAKPGDEFSVRFYSFDSYKVLNKEESNWGTVECENKAVKAIIDSNDILIPVKAFESIYEEKGYKTDQIESDSHWIGYRKDYQNNKLYTASVREISGEKYWVFPGMYSNNAIQFHPNEVCYLPENTIDWNAGVEDKVVIPEKKQFSLYIIDNTNQYTWEKVQGDFQARALFENNQIYIPVTELDALCKEYGYDSEKITQESKSGIQIGYKMGHEQTIEKFAALEMKNDKLCWKLNGDEYNRPDIYCTIGDLGDGAKIKCISTKLYKAEVGEQNDKWEEIKDSQTNIFINDGVVRIPVDAFDESGKSEGYSSANIENDPLCIGYKKNEQDNKIYAATLETDESGKKYWVLEGVSNPDKIFYIPGNTAQDFAESEFLGSRKAFELYVVDKQQFTWKKISDGAQIRVFLANDDGQRGKDVYIPTNELDTLCGEYDYNSEHITMESQAGIQIRHKKYNNELAVAALKEKNGELCWELIPAGSDYYDEGQWPSIYYVKGANTDSVIACITTGLYRLDEENFDWKKLENSDVNVLIEDGKAYIPVEAFDGKDNAEDGYNSSKVEKDNLCIGYKKSTDDSKIYVAKLETIDGKKYWLFEDVTNLDKVYYIPGNKAENFNEQEFLDRNRPPQIAFNPGNGNGNETGIWTYGNPERVLATIPQTALRNTEEEESGSGDATTSEARWATVLLPSDTELGVDFYIANGAEAVVVPNEKNELNNYRLVGWYNIADKKYYSVDDTPVEATVQVNKESGEKVYNVFYADWVMESYDLASDGGGNGQGQDTNSFVRTYVYDYNELFNLYSAEVTQKGFSGESWSNQDTSELEGAESFVFRDWTHGDGTLSNTSNLKNASIYEANKVVEGLSGITQYLFPNENLPYHYGVHYLGEGNYFYTLGDDGYYGYDSNTNAASYQQSSGKFYIRENPQITAESNNADRLDDNGGADKVSPDYGFFPLNSYRGASLKGDDRRNGFVNYFFGLRSDIQFYLPARPGTAGGSGNQYNGNDMEFKFAGDDDVWVFIVNEDGTKDLVLDLGGLHQSVSATINFSSGEVEIGSTQLDNGTGKEIGSTPLPNSERLQEEAEKVIKNLAPGNHTLQVCYMERGAGRSHCKIKFNIVPVYMIKNPEANAVTVHKNWASSLENDTSYEMTKSHKEGIEVSLYREGEGTAIGTAGLSAENNWTHTWEGLRVDVEDKYYVKEKLKEGEEYLFDVEPVEKPIIGKYSFWMETLNLSDGEGKLLQEGDKILISNQEGNKVLGLNKDGNLEAVSLTKPEVEGIVSLESLSQQAEEAVKWEVVRLNEGKFFLKNSGKYLLADGTGLSMGENNGSKFKITSVKGEGLCIVDSLSDSYRIIYENNQFIPAAKNDNDAAPENQDEDNKRVKVCVQKEVISKAFSFEITNTYRPFIIQKVDARDAKKNPLPGATFVLERERTEGEELSTVKEIYDYSASSWVAFEESTKDNYAFVLTDGILKLVPETAIYTLTETKAPEGYVLPEGGKTVSFKAENGTITLLDNADSSFAELTGRDRMKLLIKNEREKGKVAVQFKKISKELTEGKALPLQGAEFTLYAKAEAEDGADSAEPENVMATFISGEDGNFILQSGGSIPEQTDKKSIGLSCKTIYKLEETKVPNGYIQIAPVYFKVVEKNNGYDIEFLDEEGKKIEKPDDITVGAYQSGKNSIAVSVSNTKIIVLPETGGIGTRQFTTGGAMIVMAAFLMYGYSMRRRRSERRSKQ